MKSLGPNHFFLLLKMLDKFKGEILILEKFGGAMAPKLKYVVSLHYQQY